MVEATRKRVSNMQVQHLVITRFNLRLWTPQQKRNARPMEEGWLRRRIELLRSFSAPAVDAQTMQDFDWLLLIDPTTPAWARAELEAASDRISLVALDTTHGLAGVREVIKARLRSDTDLLLQTRLDSDDAIVPHYFEALHAGVVAGRTEYFDVPNGYQLLAATGRVFRRTGWRSNSFLSLAQPPSRYPRSIHDERHHKSDRIAPVRTLTTQRMWLHVIHDVNNSSKVRGGLPVSARTARARFSLDPGLFAPRGLREHTADSLRWAVVPLRRFVVKRTQLARTLPPGLADKLRERLLPRRLQAALAQVRREPGATQLDSLLTAWGPGQRQPAPAFLLHVLGRLDAGPVLSFGGGVTAVLIAEFGAANSWVVELDPDARASLQRLLTALGHREFAADKVVGSTNSLDVSDAAGSFEPPATVIATSDPEYGDPSPTYAEAIKNFDRLGTNGVGLVDDAHQAFLQGVADPDQLGEGSGWAVAQAKGKPYLVYQPVPATGGPGPR